MLNNLGKDKENGSEASPNKTMGLGRLQPENKHNREGSSGVQAGEGIGHAGNS